MPGLLELLIDEIFLGPPDLQGDDTFVGIIFMSGAKKWSNVVTNIDQLIQNVAVGTVYVASPDQADIFPQTTYKF